ncbi:MAG: GGDEF domain-containing protein [Rhizomicrobium sp.]
MKVERTSSTRGTRSVGVAAYARQAEAVAAPLAAATIGATASVLGIPESEFTPRVRDAIVTLMGEVDNLRRELVATRERLDVAEKNADQDQLLPLLNRRAFVRELTRYIGFAGRYGTPSSLIYFDLNGFKAINDSHGHAGGDAVLQNFAAVLSGNVRDSDCVGRLGGDEFGVLLSHADQDQAHKKADILAERLRAAPAQWKGTAIPVSFAYGAFELKAGDDADLAMARADEAMYANKRGGGR